MRHATALLSVFIAVGANAATPKRLAVLEFAGPPEEAARSRVFAAAAREGALRALEGSQIELMSREAMDVVLKEMGPCAPDADDCEIDIGRKIQADLVVTGELTAVDGAYHVTLKLHETEKGTLLATEFIAKLSEETASEEVRQLAMNVVSAGLHTLETARFGGGLMFGTGGRLVAPRIRIGSQVPVGSADFNVESEKLLERALDLQDSPTATSEQRAEAWCDLSRAPGVNPYLPQANDGCAAWREYAKRRAVLERRAEADYKALLDFLKLKRPTVEQKLMTMDRYLVAYRDLPQNEKVLLVSNARFRSARTSTLVLPDASADATTVADEPSRAKGRTESGTPIRAHVLRGIALAGVGLSVVSLLIGVLGVAASIALFVTGSQVVGADRYRDAFAPLYYTGLGAAAFALPTAVIIALVSAIAVAASIGTSP